MIKAQIISLVPGDYQRSPQCSNKIILATKVMLLCPYSSYTERPYTIRSAQPWSSLCILLQCYDHMRYHSVS